MKKIGILTFHNSSNFGALLQTFGTYQTLVHLGYKPEVINYHSPNKAHLYKRLHLSHKLSFVANVKGIFSFPLKHAKFKKSSNFRRDYLNINAPILTSFEDLSRHQERFEKVIVGSDQVWNYDNTQEDKRYFLDFVPAYKRIAYAPSFGKNVVDDKYTGVYKKYLSEIPHLSVREDAGVTIVQDLIGKRALQVLDPTLILARKDWESISHFNFNFKNYLLVYVVGNRDETLKVAKRIAKEKNLNIVLIATRLKDYFSGIKVVNPSINAFVGLMQNSSYVVTSSFHGAAFAIHFNKEFTVCLEKEGSSNSRQLSLLNMTQLTERVSFDSQAQMHTQQTIQWDHVNQILEHERKKSIDFLASALKSTS